MGNCLNKPDDEVFTKPTAIILKNHDKIDIEFGYAIGASEGIGIMFKDG